MNTISLIKSLAPEICPQCEAQSSFAILQDRITCRRCGYALRKDDGRPLTPAEAVPPPPARVQLSQPLRASYRTTQIGPIDRWAHAAFDTGQDYVRQENWEEALKAFYRAIDAQRDFVDPHLWIARIIDDPVKKREHLTTVLAYQPNHLEALRELMILDGRIRADIPSLYDPYMEPEVRLAGGAVGTETQNLRCKRCGSTQMTTDEMTGLVVCESCNYADERPQNRRMREGTLTMALLERRAQPVRWVVGERLLACNSCGAERTIPARKLSENCPFCGSNHVIQKDVLDSFQQPDGLIPFTISRKKAESLIKERLGGWMERVKGWFDNNRVMRATIEGVYLPFWVFDAMIEVRRTVVRDQDGRRDHGWVIPHNVYNSTTATDAMNNVAVCAVKSPPPLLTNRLGRYDMSRMIAYEPSHLAKFPAELYSMDFDKASLEARAVISRAMREKYGHSVSTGTQINVSSGVKHMTFQLVLKPVWVATLYEDDGDVRTALVNGQTGRVALGKARKPRG